MKTSIEVPSEVFSQWEKLYEYGDYTALQKETGYSLPTIAKALKSGTASPEVMRAINSFYADKQKRKEKSESKLTKELMSQLQPAI